MNKTQPKELTGMQSEGRRDRSAQTQGAMRVPQPWNLKEISLEKIILWLSFEGWGMISQLGGMVGVLVRERMSREKAGGLEAQRQFGEALKF